MTLLRILTFPFAALLVAIGLGLFLLLAIIDGLTGSRWNWPTKAAKKI